MQKSFLRHAVNFLLLATALSSCNQLFFHPKFGYLNKVAVMARTEADTVMAHISEWKEIRSMQQNDSLPERQVCQSENPGSSDKLRPDVPGPIRLSLNETKRILTQYPELFPRGLRGDSKASADGMNGWVLGLLVFFGSLVLFAVLIAWAIQEQMGCLASGLAVFALLFEIWLVMFVLM